METALAIRSMPVRLPSGVSTATVVGVDGLPLEDAEAFLTYLRTVGSSRNTVVAYARHLALWFRWLASRGAGWEVLDFEGLCMFVQDLADGTVPALHRAGAARAPRPRSRATQEAVLAAVCSFLDFWRLEGRGPQDLNLYRASRSSGRTTYRFLAHIEMRRERQERRIKIKGPKSPPPRIVDFEDDFVRLLTAASTARDRALLSALYDGGLRIGQALGLRHEDLDLARQRVNVIRREDNANAMLSKQRATFKVDLPGRFFEFYGESLVEEQLALGIDSDYVFVTLAPGPFLGRAMTYANAVQRIKALGRRAGVELTPHTLRHTHGTALAKASWSAPEIAKRLGQSSATSADVYIHLADSDVSEKYWSTLGKTEHR